MWTYSQHGCSHQRAKVTPPHSLQREVVTHLLETEQHASNWTAKRHSNARSRTRAQNLPRLRRVATILVEEPAYDIACANGIVHTRTLLSHTETTRNGQRQPNTLDEQRRSPKKPLHHKPSNDTLHLTDPTARSIRREALNQRSSRQREKRRKPHIQHVVHRPNPAPALPLSAPSLSAPAAKRLIQVKRRTAMAQLNIAQPLRHDIQKRSIQPNRRPHKRNYNPRLTRIIRLGNLPPPLAPAAAKKHSTAAMLVDAEKAGFTACFPP